jgi:hypothetical protein
MQCTSPSAAAADLDVEDVVRCDNLLVLHLKRGRSAFSAGSGVSWWWW